MKRFYAQADAVAGCLLLDGRRVKTPGRSDLILPTQALADAAAAEWNAQGETIDPRTMKLTGLANAAIDGIAPDPDAFAAGLALYGESDLLCYRAEAPPSLVARQAALWDPILGWARNRFDVDFVVVSSIVHKQQPEETVRRLGQAVRARDPFALAGLSPLVTIGGSLVIALALAEGAIGLDEAWAAAVADELWQAETWGEDAEAARALTLRRADFEAAHRFLMLLHPAGD